MGIKFGDSSGAAGKSKIDRVELKFGENRVRMYGDLVQRYVYWIEGEKGKKIPFECLEFDRETGKFGGTGEKDWVKEFYPDIKCQYGFAIMALQNGESKLWDLKKTLTQEILGLAKDPEVGLGDPTDPDTGWDVVFSKDKTGPNPMNVKYNLAQLKLKKRALTDAERETIAKARPIEELMPRPTAEQQKELLEKIQRGGSEETADEEISEEFNVK